MNPLKPLHDLAERGLQPVGRLVWLGLGRKPLKSNAIEINPDHLPTDHDCKAVAGLDVIVIFHGFTTKYGVLQRFSRSLYQARPRRLQLIDLDMKRIAYLKVAS